MAAQPDWRTWPLPARLKYLGGLRYQRWKREANPGQLPPENWERTWYAQGPRGSGKTRCGTETFAHLILSHPPGDWACIGPTFGDARDTLIEHRRSGLKKALGEAVTNWNRTEGELYVANGSTVYCDGADDGALRIQGKELRGALCDEIGLWRSTKTRKGEEKGGIRSWQESIDFAVREPPGLILAIGTPKGKHGVVKLLTEEPEGRVAFTYPRLEDNEANLMQSVVEGWRRRYGGTRLGRQELLGEILEDVEGALWTIAMIEANRHALPTEGARRTVVAVDPAITAGEDSDETGIVAACCYGAATPFPKANLVAGEAVDHGFVLADRSGRYSPRGWATEAIELYHATRADRIVAEKNQGGEMVAATIRSVDPNVPIRLVWAAQGKRPRAEPVSALYEQGRVHHIEPLPELENEMTAWVPGEDSPSRMDALVWAITDLMLEGGQDFAFGAEASAEEAEPPITAGLLDRRW